MLTERKIKGIDIFLPWVESIGLVLYCSLVLLFNMRFQPGASAALLFFLPLAGFELWLSLRYEEKRLLSFSGIISQFLRMLFLFAFFYVWSVSILPDSHLASYRFLTSAGPWFPSVAVVLFARLRMASLTLIALAFTYYMLFVRLKKGRFFSSILLPWLFFFALLFIYYTDIFGGVSRKKVEAQPDVKIFFPYPTADFATGRFFSSWLNTFKHPRCLQIDKERKKLYCSFGSSYVDLSEFPNLLEIDIETKNYRALTLRTWRYGQKNIRNFSFFPENTPKIYVTHWGSDFNIYGISKKDFKVIEKIDIGHRKEIKDWQPLDIFYNGETETVYILNGINFLLIAYHLNPVRRGGVYPHPDKVEIIDLVKEGVVGEGAKPDKLRFSSARNKLYMWLAGGKKSILAVEFETLPLRLSRVFKLPKDGNLSTKLPGIQKIHSTPIAFPVPYGLYEVNLNEFQIIKKIRRPMIIFTGILIDNTSNLIYCLDYLRGRVLVMDRHTWKIYRKYWVGNKPFGIFRFGQRIFVCSTLGIIEIKIK